MVSAGRKLVTSCKASRKIIGCAYETVDIVERMLHTF